MYKVNEIFYSLQGEGHRAGSANVFLRFSDCNLRCSKHREGFDCDTEFDSGAMMDAQLVAEGCRTVSDPKGVAVIITGGEPALQVDEVLVEALHEQGFYHIAVETNGLLPIRGDVDWISVSPKTAEHTLKITQHVDELRYVRNVSQSIPVPSLEANHYFISPAWDAVTGFEKSLPHCVQLVKDNPIWRLSVQHHKIWGVR